MFKKMALASLFLVYALSSQASTTIKTKTDACYVYAEMAYNIVILKERGFSEEYVISQIQKVAPEDKTTPNLIKLIYKEIPKGADSEAVRKVTFEVCME